MEGHEPFKAVLTADHAAMAKFSEKDWIEIVIVTHAGMSTADFEAIVADWLPKSKNPVFGIPVTKLVYQPMLEVMQLLRANGYRPTSSPAAGRSSCGPIRRTSTAFRPSK